MFKHIVFALAVAAAGLPVVAGAQVRGAGSTAAAPVYRVWSTGYAAASGVTLSYDAVGSGEGLKRIRAGDVDFGASDVPLSAAEASKAGLVCVPSVVTGAVPFVNVPGVPRGQLKLTGELLAQIFLGKVETWDAPELRALNPGMTLPKLKIHPVVRADGSGTTYHFTDYLSAVSPEWKATYGARSTVSWPAGFTAAKGSTDVVKAVQATPGAIGYVDYNYVVDNDLNGVQLRNAAGRFVSGQVSGFREAVLQSAWNRKGDFTAPLVNLPGAETWPITMGTFIIVPAVSRSGTRTLAALKFLTWGYFHGDELAARAKFVPLPERVQASAYRELSRVTDASGTPIGLQSMPANWSK
ncbi:phosphate ABC transporter substrate-binding protein PstS [Ralstonia mannitolilytica]|uniref:phosphate ABC transporter substrate-binding protein PstS n=1 Tax=Ralstonia mannitolilytica TaxID=105219 RepID=UPI0013DDFA9C|nr:phosphate ABC transporter substrate-binding protein PstS [Ralstonia mannitolilytica]QIF08897.1 phosphate ABC transporter substrate-binding protein PstS [Ralstonia mannitolilytica]CAJ0728081.1 Phosphate-binding protein PstS [Ralstonia mannitolilytica]CAJ0785723.1 Phosphate-binding protein PstS [Ralstonia mannitolilytica]